MPFLVPRFSLGGGSVGGGIADAYAVAGFSPDLVADFSGDYYRTGGSDSTFAGVVDGFARTGAALYFNSSGDLASAATGVARTDDHRYNGSSWEATGLRIETVARTGLITTASSLNSLYWTKFQASVGVDVSASLYGSTTADRLTATGTGVHIAARVTSLATGQYTIAIAGRPSDTDFITLSYNDAPGGTGRYWVGIFDLNAGTHSTATGSSAGVVDAAGMIDVDGMYICWITGSGIPATNFNIALSDSASPTFDVHGRPSFAAGTTSVDLSDVNVFAGGPFSTPITGAVTQNAETVSIGSSKLSPSTSAMSFQLEGRENYLDDGTAGQVELLDWRVDANNRITCYLDTDGSKTGEIRVEVVNGGTSADVTAAYLSPGYGQPFNIAFCAADNDRVALSVGGATTVTDTLSTALPDLSSADLVLEGMGSRAQLRQWDADIGNSGLETAST